MESVYSAINELAKENDLSKLKTISVTSFGEMFVLLDEQKKVICESITYEDPGGMDAVFWITVKIMRRLFRVKRLPG